MYTTQNFKTKKALKEAVKEGRRVTYFQPGLFNGNEPTDGTVYLEGPHSPEPHRWWAEAKVRGGIIVSVK